MSFVMHTERRRTFSSVSVNSSLTLQKHHGRKWKVPVLTCHRYAVPLKVDIESPKSVLANANIKTFINERTLSLLPPSSQRRLLMLLPACDRVLSPIDRYTLTLGAKALNNEFFSKSCVEWSERLAQGEFMPENRQLLKSEEEKEPNKLDDWKRRHFQNHWGVRRKIGTSLDNEQQTLERSLASKRRRLLRVKKDDIVDSITDDIMITPQQVMRRAQIRGPGRPRGFSFRQRISRFPQSPRNSHVHSASSSEIAVKEEFEKAEKIPVEDGQLSSTSSAEDSNHQFIMNGDHDYFQVLNEDPTAERSTAIEADSVRNRPLNSFNYIVAISSDDECSAGNYENAVDSSCVSGASSSCTSNLLLSGVETDHAYAKRAPAPDELQESRQFVNDGDGNVLARLTILNARSSCQPSGPSCHRRTPSLPCVQKCTVTLNKLDDAVFAQQPRIKLQLRHIKQHSAVDEHSTLENCHWTGDICRAASNGYLSSASDGPITANVSQGVSDLCSSSIFVHPGDSAVPVPAWTPVSSSAAHNSGLELLASVSSLTADRLQETPWPVDTLNGSSDDVSYRANSDGSCRKTSPFTSDTSSKRRVKVFCIRKKCSTDGSTAEQNGPTSAQLLGVVRDFVAKGGNEPVCGTLPSRLASSDARLGQVPCTRRSEEIACNSLLFLHNSHSPLYNGLTELH